MFRRNKQDQQPSERMSGKQQRPSAGEQEGSNMRSHDQTLSSQAPVRLATRNPATQQEFQIAHDEGGGMRQKDISSSRLSDSGARLKENLPAAPSPLSAQGNTREHESSSHAGDSTPAKSDKTSPKSSVFHGLNPRFFTSSIGPSTTLTTPSARSEPSIPRISHPSHDTVKASHAHGPRDSPELNLGTLFPDESSSPAPSKKAANPAHEAAKSAHAPRDSPELNSGKLFLDEETSSLPSKKAVISAHDAVKTAHAPRDSPELTLGTLFPEEQSSPSYSEKTTNPAHEAAKSAHAPRDSPELNLGTLFPEEKSSSVTSGPPTTFSRPGVIVAPSPIHPAHAAIQSAQNTPRDSRELNLGNLFPEDDQASMSGNPPPSSYHREASFKSFDVARQDAPSSRNLTSDSSIVKPAAAQFFNSSASPAEPFTNKVPKKKTTWYGMEVLVKDKSANRDPLAPKKAKPFSLGFGYKDHKKAAIAAASAASTAAAAAAARSAAAVRSPATAITPSSSAISSSLTVSHPPVNPISVQPSRLKAADRSSSPIPHSFSPSQDRPVHIQETMHAPSHPTTVAHSAALAAPKIDTPFTSAPVVSRVNAPSATVPFASAPVAAPLIAAPILAPSVAAAITARSNAVNAVNKSTVSLSHSISPSQDRPVHAPETAPLHSRSHPSTSISTASVPASTTTSVLTTSAKPAAPKSHYLSHSGSFKERIASSPKLSKALKGIPASMGRSLAPTGPVVMRAPAANTLPPPTAQSIPGAFPVDPVVAATVVHSVVPVYSTPTGSNVNLASFPGATKHRVTGATLAPAKDPKAVVPAYSTPNMSNSDLPSSISSIGVAAAVPLAAASVLKKLNSHTEPPKVVRADGVPINNAAVVPPTPSPTVASITPGLTPHAAAAVPVAVIAGSATLPVHHSTAATLKAPKKDLSLYDEEESTYPRGDETAKHENPAHPAVVEDIVEIKKLPKELPAVTPHSSVQRLAPATTAAVSVAIAAVPATVVAKSMTLPEHHSTAAALKTPKKDLSLYDEEESTYPRGDETVRHDNPAHPAVTEDIVEVKKLPKVLPGVIKEVPVVIKEVPVIVETKEVVPATEKHIDGARRGSQSSMKDKVKGAFSGFHMPKRGHKKDDAPEVAAMTTTTTTSVAEVKHVAAVAATVPIAASIAAALRESHHDERVITPPHQELTAAPALITAPLFHKPTAPLIEEEHTTSISARKLEPLSVLPPSGSVMVTDKATTTDSLHPSREVTSHPHASGAIPVTVAAPVTIAAAAPVTTTISTTTTAPVKKETAEIATSTHHSTATVHQPTATVQHPTVAATLANAAAPMIPVVAVPATTHIAPTTSDSTPISNSFKTKASHLAAAVAAPLTAAKDKLTGHHHDEATVVPAATATTTTTTTTSAPHPISTTTAAHTTTKATADHPTTSPTSKVSRLASAVTAPLVATKDKLTGHHHDHPETPTTATAAATTHTTTSPTSKAAHLAAAVTAPLIAAKEKLTGHHSDHTTTTSSTHSTTPSTTAAAFTPESISASSARRLSRSSVDMPKEEVVVEKKVLGKASDDVASKIPHNDNEEVIMVETTTTKTITTIPPTRTHVYEPGGIPAAAMTPAHVEKPVEAKHTEVKTMETHNAHPAEAKPIEVKHTETHEVKPVEVKHESTYMKPVVAAVAGAASAVAAVFSGKKESTVMETDKAMVGKTSEISTVPHKSGEEVVMKETTTTTTTTDEKVAPTAPAHTVQPVIQTHVTKAAETVAAAVPVTGAAVKSIVHPVDKDHHEATTVTTEKTVVDKAHEVVASTVPHKDGEDVVLMKTTTTTEITSTADLKGKGKHEDHHPIVAVAPVVVEAPVEPISEVTVTETKEAKKERKKKEKAAKKAEAKKNKVPLKAKFQRITGPGLAAAAAAAISYEDRLPMHSMPVLQVQEAEVNHPAPPVVATPFLTMTEDDVEKPEIPVVPAPIFTVTEDDIVQPVPILTKHPVLTVSEEDVEWPSAMNAPHPVIPYVAPKLVSTSALKLASAPRPMIPDQPVQGKDIKFPKVKVPKVKVPKVKIPKVKAPKMPKLKKKAKVETAAAVVVPVTTAVKTMTTTTKTIVEPEVMTHVVEPVKPVVILEVPTPIVETVTTRVIEPVVVPKPKPVVVAAPKVVEVPKPVVVEAAKPVIVQTVVTKVVEEVIAGPKPKPVIVETVAEKVVEAPKPVEVPKPVVVPVPVSKPVIVEAPPKPIEVPKPVPVVVVPPPQPAPAPVVQTAKKVEEVRVQHIPAPAPVVIPTISTNVETIIPDGYSGSVPRVAADESLIWVKKVSTRNDYYDSEDEDELDEFGYRKDRDVSLYIAPPNINKPAIRGGRGNTTGEPVNYTLANHTNAGIVNSSQPQQKTMMGSGGYNTQPRQSAI